MDKFCVFCGNKPEKKNKEHIIPKWLVKLTGADDRMAYWGVDYQDVFDFKKTELKGRKYSFMNFAFPACMKCNSQYGDELESKAQNIIIKILNSQPINEDEIVVLLDWFDKIRVGLWLGYLYYNKDMAVRPKFHISSRIGKTDRVLFVYRTEDKQTGINFFGPGTPLFSSFPICLGFRINDYFFVNISKDNLLLADLGFHYPNLNKATYDREGNYEITTFTIGTKKINQGFYHKLNLKKTDIMVFQPIYGKLSPIYRELDKAKVDDSVNQYIRDNTYDTEKGLGKVFVYDDGCIKPMTKKGYCFTPKEKFILFSTLMKMTSLKISKFLVASAEEAIESMEKIENMENTIDQWNNGIKYEKWLMRIRREKIDQLY